MRKACRVHQTRLLGQVAKLSRELLLTLSQLKQISASVRHDSGADDGRRRGVSG